MEGKRVIAYDAGVEVEVSSSLVVNEGELRVRGVCRAWKGKFEGGRKRCNLRRSRQLLEGLGDDMYTGLPYS